MLVRVHAASVNLGDWEILTADPLTVLAGIFRPKPRHDPVSSNDGGAPARKGGPRPAIAAPSRIHNLLPRVTLAICLETRTRPRF